MRSKSAIAALVRSFSASLGLLVASSVSAQPSDSAAGRANQCFYSNQYQDFRAIDDHSFYIRVGVSDVYRIELSGTCPALLYPDAFLVTVVRGSNLICGPLDWDLRVSEPGPGSIATPCIVSAQTKLSKAEAAAIPRKLRP